MEVILIKIEVNENAFELKKRRVQMVVIWKMEFSILLPSDLSRKEKQSWLQRAEFLIGVCFFICRARQAAFSGFYSKLNWSPPHLTHIYESDVDLTVSPNSLHKS